MEHLIPRCLDKKDMEGSFQPLVCVSEQNLYFFRAANFVPFLLSISWQEIESRANWLPCLLLASCTLSHLSIMSFIIDLFFLPSTPNSLQPSLTHSFHTVHSFCLPASFVLIDWAPPESRLLNKNTKMHSIYFTLANPTHHFTDGNTDGGGGWQRGGR